MKIRGIAFAAMLAALPAAAPAPQGIEPCVAWAKSWEEAKIEATERNVPIMFTIQQDENPGSKQMESAFRDATFIAQSRRVVCVVANPDTKHGIREVMVGKVKTPFCRAYDGMTCEVHTGCQKGMEGLIKAGDFDIPTQIWCRPDGKELFKFTGPNGSGVQNAGALIKDMERALDRISGPKMGRKEWEEIKKLLRDGDEAQSRPDYKLALKIFKAVSESKFEFFAKQGKQRYDDFIHQCVGIVARAVKQYQQNPEGSEKRKEVKPILLKIAKEMKGTEAGDAADKALKEVVK
jgi:hypothetical protein